MVLANIHSLEKSLRIIIFCSGMRAARRRPAEPSRCAPPMLGGSFRARRDMSCGSAEVGFSVLWKRAGDRCVEFAFRRSRHRSRSQAGLVSPMRLAARSRVARLCSSAGPWLDRCRRGGRGGAAQAALRQGLAQAGRPRRPARGGAGDRIAGPRPGQRRADPSGRQRASARRRTELGRRPAADDRDRRKPASPPAADLQAEKGRRARGWSDRRPAGPRRLRRRNSAGPQPAHLLGKVGL